MRVVLRASERVNSDASIRARRSLAPPFKSVPKTVMAMVDNYRGCAIMTLHFYHGGAEIQLSRQGARPD